MQIRQCQFLAKAVIAIAVVKIFVNLFSFKSQALHSQHDVKADVPIVAYAITLTRIPEGLEGRTTLDAVEVSGQQLRPDAKRSLSHESSTIAGFGRSHFAGPGALN
jgi:hypothetical protein